MHRLIVLFVGLTVCLTMSYGCGDDIPGIPDTGLPDANVDADVPPRAECENINPHYCMLPWPSSRFLEADETTETGYRIAIDDVALPVNRLEEVADAAMFERFDGFSPATAMMTFFPVVLDTTNLPDETRIPDSLLPGSPTVILDAETGERVAHFSEVDGWMNFTQSAERRGFYIRPATRLLEDRRYIVAIRDLRDMEGNAVPASEYFVHLRDGTTSDDAALESRRANFEDIFAQLDVAGVERSSLIEAWDFHTASGESIWGDIVHMRDDMLTRLGERGIGCTVESVREDVNDEVFREVRGTFTVPLYMTNEFTGADMTRDAQGRPMFNRNVEAPFYLYIPRSVETRVRGGGDPVRLMVYGHGLLGLGSQAGSHGTRTVAERLEVVSVGTDWWGLSEPDETTVITDVVTNWGGFPKISDRLLQGVLNFAALTRSIQGVCSDLPELQIDGRPVFGDETYYFGISQGGIMGASLAAMTPDIERFGLQVGAVSYPMMIRRSVDFLRFEIIYQTWYPDKVDRDFFLVASSSLWDQSDPATFAPHLLSGGGPTLGPRHILYQTSRYDTEVANIASDYGARTMGLPWFSSSVYEPWNMTATDGPSDSGYVIYHVEGVEPVPIGCQPPIVENDAHSGLRYVDSMQRQLGAFFAPDGQVENFCDGPCDPD